MISTRHMHFNDLQTYQMTLNIAIELKKKRRKREKGRQNKGGRCTQKNNDPTTVFTKAKLQN